LCGDVDRSNIILYDEGSGGRGQGAGAPRAMTNVRSSYALFRHANGVIGSIVVARADRLFRDKLFRNVSMATELAE
jgi:hypothetical protein